MPDRIQPPPPAPGAAPDGNQDMIRSGIWMAKPLVAVEAFPEALVLTAADLRLAAKLKSPAILCRRRIGRHVVELLLERGEDRSVDLALRIPTAENQFKDPYILMEAEEGNGREVAVREFQFHLQGRLEETEIAAADWSAFFAAAARELEALRPGRAAAKGNGAPGRSPVRGDRAAARTPAGGGRAKR